MPQERRVPTQKRSREKYDLILTTAKMLIGERGNDSVSMREIAKQAGLAISSIYQYFPDKNAILAAIMQEYFDHIRALMTGYLDHCENMDDLHKGLSNGIDMFYAQFKQEPALAVLWAGLQANQTLKELDAEDSRMNAKLISERIIALYPNVDAQKTYSAALLFVHASGMTVRLALSVPKEEADALVEEYKFLSLLRLNSLAAEQ